MEKKFISKNDWIDELLKYTLDTTATTNYTKGVKPMCQCQNKSHLGHMILFDYKECDTCGRHASKKPKTQKAKGIVSLGE